MAKPEKSARFKYRLETVLRVRHIHEKQAQERFLSAQRKVEEEKNREEKLRDDLQFSYQEFRAKMLGEVPSPTQITLHKYHLEHLKEELESQKIRVREAEDAQEKCRLELIEAAKDRKIIEKDRGKKRDVWKKVMDKEESKFLDNIAGIRFEMRKRQ